VNLYAFFAIIISIGALLLSLLAYVYRITPSLSAKFDTEVSKGKLINYGGENPLFAGEPYLDLFLINFGPGIATDITWELSIVGYDSKKFPLTGQLSFLQPSVPINVQGLLKIETKHKENVQKEWERAHPKESLENDQESLKEIEHKIKNIPKYVLNLEYSSLVLLGKDRVGKRGITMLFNEEGRFISAKRYKNENNNSF